MTTREKGFYGMSGVMKRIRTGRAKGDNNISPLVTWAREISVTHEFKSRTKEEEEEEGRQGGGRERLPAHLQALTCQKNEPQHSY